MWIGRDLPAFDRKLEVRETDLGGRRVIPGLIDGHVHLTGGGGEAGPDTPGAAGAADAASPRGGVTTVVGVLGTDDVTRTTGRAGGRHARACGGRAERLVPHRRLPRARRPRSPAPSAATSCIVDRIIGVGEVALSDHRSSQPTLDELLALAAEAHVAGLMSGKAGIVHLHLGDGPRGLELVRDALDESELPPRVFNPTHVNRRQRALRRGAAAGRARA